MEFLARVNPKYLAAISLFAAKNDVRYYLNGVSIEPHPDGGAVIVATDGRRLAAIHDPEGMATKKLIIETPAPELMKALKMKSYQKFLKPESCWIAERCAVVTWDGFEKTNGGQKIVPEPFGTNAIVTAKSQLIDAKYPDWRRLMPTERSEKIESLPAVNPKYLGDLNAAAEILGIKYPCVRLEGRGETLSVIARMHAGDLLDRFIGIIMPMKADPIPTILPSWLTPELKPKKPRVKVRGGELVIGGDMEAAQTCPVEEAAQAA